MPPDDLTAGTGPPAPDELPTPHQVPVTDVSPTATDVSQPATLPSPFQPFVPPAPPRVNRATRP